MLSLFKFLNPSRTSSNPSLTSDLPWSNRQYIPLEKEEDDVYSEAGGSSKLHRFRPQELLARIRFSQVALSILVFLSGATSIVIYDDLSKVGSLHIPGVPKDVSESMYETTWMPDSRFALDRDDEISTAAWQSLESRFIWVENSESKGLQPSAPRNAHRQVYSLALFHQLHCVGVIRFAWHSLLRNGSSVLAEEYPGSFAEYTIGGHFEHCVEIVRQALMCYADPTLEPMLEEDGSVSDAGIATGWGAKHQCRNYEKIVDWIDEQPKVKAGDTAVVLPGTLGKKPVGKR